MKKLISFLAALALCLCLGTALTDTAYAGDLDYIHRYDVNVTPNADDGSLRIRVDFEWEVLDQGPVEWLQIGIPTDRPSMGMESPYLAQAPMVPLVMSRSLVCSTSRAWRFAVVVAAAWVSPRTPTRVP